MMKIKMGLLLCAVAVFAMGCKKKHISQIQSAMASGTWHISKYKHNQEDQTATYSAYTFTFDSDGTMTGVASATTTGSWNVVKETGDGIDNYLSFIINLPNPLNDLSQVWNVETHEDDKIELSGAGDNNIDIDELVFEKD